jgi:hypothetical protein
MNQISFLYAVISVDFDAPRSQSMITKGIIQIDRKFLKKYDQAKGDSLFKIANTTQVHA